MTLSNMNLYVLKYSLKVGVDRDVLEIEDLIVLPNQTCPWLIIWFQYEACSKGMVLMYEQNDKCEQNVL